MAPGNLPQARHEDDDRRAGLEADDVETDIRRPEQSDKVKICEAMRGNDAIWGYNLWNERLELRVRRHRRLHQHLAMLRTWDPTHPVWVGTYLGYFLDRWKARPAARPGTTTIGRAGWTSTTTR